MKTNKFIVGLFFAAFWFSACHKDQANPSSGVAICSGPASVTDFDGNAYDVVSIGSQCWTKQNLKTKHFRNGTAIPTGLADSVWAIATTAAYATYGGDSTVVDTFGILYNYYAVADPAGLCPTGFHVPTDTDWVVLSTYLGGKLVAGGKLKESGTNHWMLPNYVATNSSGFTALPGGYRAHGGSYNDKYAKGYFWSSSLSDADSAIYRTLNHENGGLDSPVTYKKAGFSVRCVRD